MECYNHSTLRVERSGAASLAIKRRGVPAAVYQLTAGAASISTDDFAEGEYVMQYFDADDNVLGTEPLTVRQNIKFAPDSYDGRSRARIALEAITAFMEGRATAQQRRVQVGDKSIEYSSFEELLKWKSYFEGQVRREDGRAARLRNEKIVWRG